MSSFTAVIGIPGAGKTSWINAQVKGLIKREGRRRQELSTAQIEVLNRTREKPLTPPNKIPLYTNFEAEYKIGGEIHKPYYITPEYFGLPNDKKPAVKRSEPKPAAPKKEPTSVKKPARAKKSAADKLLMHNDKDEMKVDSKKPIVINGANIKPKPVPKVLRRVAKSGGYTAWDDVKRNGKTFATEQEAKDYAADVLKKTGKIVPISPTDRQVTHTFKPEEEKKKK